MSEPNLSSDANPTITPTNGRARIAMTGHTGAPPIARPTTSASSKKRGTANKLHRMAHRIGINLFEYSTPIRGTQVCPAALAMARDCVNCDHLLIHSSLLPEPILTHLRTPTLHVGGPSLRTWKRHTQRAQQCPNIGCLTGTGGFLDDKAETVAVKVRLSRFPLQWSHRRAAPRCRPTDRPRTRAGPLHSDAG